MDSGQDRVACKMRTRNARLKVKWTARGGVNDPEAQATCKGRKQVIPSVWFGH
jgi:hypothetical protein